MSRAVIFIITSTFFFSLMQIGVKKISHIPAIEIAWFRAVFGIFFSFIYLHYKKIPLFGTHKRLLILRGVFGTTALVMFYYSVQQMPLASAVTIQYLSPLFTVVIAVFIFKEKMSLFEWMAFLCCLIGVYLIKGFDDRVSLSIVAIGVSAAFFAGMAYNIIRKIGQREHPLVIIFYFPLVTIPMLSFPVYKHWVMPVGMDWLWIVLIGVSVQTAQIFMTMAYQMEEASKVVPFKYLGVGFALAIGYMVFGEKIPLLSFVGIAVIILSLLGTNYLRRRRS